MSELYTPEVGVQVTEENPIAASAARSLATYMEKSEEAERKAPLPHQRIILQDVLQGFQEGMQRGYVESPTATGKTYLMARLAEGFYNAGDRVLILCDRRQQADQILGKAGDTGLIQVTDAMDLRDIGTHYEQTHATPADRVVISTYASLNHFAQTGELGEFQVILGDEAHKSLGPVTSANLINFCPNAIKIGFTATPTYSIDKKVGQIFDAPFHSTSLKEAIENDLVAPVHCLIYATDEEIPFFENTQEYTQKELEKLISLRPRNDKAIEFAKDFIKDGRQGIIGCVPGSNLAHARMLAKDLDGDFVKLDDGRFKFIRARSVGNHQSNAENRKALSEFESGQVDILMFVDMISEGWNSNVASFLIDLEPTASKVKKTQKIGRVIRKKANNLPSIVVDFMDISRKHQITALDVLQEKHFVIGKSFGARTPSGEGSSGRPTVDRLFVERIINSSLWLELERIDMHKVADLRLRATSDEPSVRDPIFAKYEQLLGRGYEREPGNSMMLPESTMRELGAFIRHYTRMERMVPDQKAVEGFIKEKMPSQHEEIVPLLAQLALQGFDAEPAGIIYRDPRIPDEYELEDEVLYNERIDTVRRCLEALPERERRIIEMRFGFATGQKEPLETIAHELDLTRERVRQLEGQALSRLSALRELWTVIN